MPYPVTKVVKTIQSLFLTATGATPSTTGGAATPVQVELGTNDIDLWLMDFDASTDESAQWTFAMPLNWDGGTVTAAFFWTANSTSTNSVVWGAQGRAFGDDVTLDQAMGTAQTVTDANTATANQLHISSATPAITLAGSPAGGQLVQIKAYRDADNGSDTLAADARLIGIRLNYSVA